MEFDLAVEILRWVADEPQPGLVEFRLTDRHGRDWSFVEKSSIPSSELLDAASAYPRPGSITVTMAGSGADEAGRPFVLVNTSKPWLVGSTSGDCVFEIAADASTVLPSLG